MRIAKRDALDPNDDPRTWTQRLPEAIDAAIHQNGPGIRATRKNWSLPAWYLPALWPQGTSVGPRGKWIDSIFCAGVIMNSLWVAYHVLMGWLLRSN